jgi:hypothetical protein
MTPPKLSFGGIGAIGGVTILTAPPPHHYFSGGGGGGGSQWRKNDSKTQIIK